jgi:hypothetical protein
VFISVSFLAVHRCTAGNPLRGYAESWELLQKATRLRPSATALQAKGTRILAEATWSPLEKKIPKRQKIFTEGNKGNKDSELPNLKTFVVFVLFC